MWQFSQLAVEIIKSSYKQINQMNYVVQNRQRWKKLQFSITYVQLHL